MKAGLVTPVDCTSTTDSETDQGRLGPSHQEHPAVWPRLTYSITDLWAGRITEAVRSSWDALSLALDQPASNEPDEYQGLPDIQKVIANRVSPGYVDMVGMVNQSDHKITVEPDPEPKKGRNWGRLLTRG